MARAVEAALPPPAMNATVSSLGAPPLPLVLDLAALTCFCTESLDDAVEDAVKLCVLSTAGWLVWRLLRRTRCGTRAARAGAGGPLGESRGGGGLRLRRDAGRVVRHCLCDL